MHAVDWHPTILAAAGINAGTCFFFSFFLSSPICDACSMKLGFDVSAKSICSGQANLTLRRMT